MRRGDQQRAAQHLKTGLHGKGRARRNEGHASRAQHMLMARKFDLNHAAFQQHQHMIAAHARCRGHIAAAHRAAPVKARKRDQSQPVIGGKGRRRAGRATAGWRHFHRRKRNCGAIHRCQRNSCLSCGIA